ncbi:hypothetical protein CC1G_11391 [Coprinopsis cinerea okayama7|uniref:Uncharacterized protein n=1 Tax=Coprinopsis cinerea (strain Okayama-7 / 130 / ATCC MYA-4618 / FGSC 9003) TaxID=240176 RepID=A8PGJ2_COPC7|nr:hypothetical protein CC1G_11391 [Coprinopsis cinerea okayama7\|eukprot:XP_001841228.1 hypothetical protein CC1G_11391 [Coprinopsis cinerea okayama7\
MLDSESEATRTAFPDSSRTSQQLSARGIAELTHSTFKPSQTVPVPVDPRPISQPLWIGVQVYGFLGLGIVGCVIVVTFSWYLYSVVWQRRMQDMPDDLERDIDFQMASQNLPRRRVYTVQAYSGKKAHRNDFKREGEQSLTPGRNSELSWDKQRVSWASSIATVQNEKSQGTPPGLKRRPSLFPPSGSSDKPLKGILRHSTGDSEAKEIDGLLGEATPATPSIAVVPRAYTEPPRHETHIENRALIGNDLIGTTTPADTARWARPSNAEDEDGHQDHIDGTSIYFGNRFG